MMMSSEKELWFPV